MPHKGRNLAKWRYGMEFIGQKGQDRWVIEEAMPGVRGGFFLDLAATDGVSINNTLLLERELGWTGIAIEPNVDYFSALIKNRSCLCFPDCIDEVSREVQFLANDELGGIVDTDTDNSPQIRPALIEEWREGGRLQTLKTRTLADLLDQAKAPSVIDYFSFDVEGAETRILRTFPFDRYTFLATTIERPTPEINEILFSHGYLFVKNVSFDTFYIHETSTEAATIRRERFEQIPQKDW
jgi:hypothetical protein